MRRILYVEDNEDNVAMLKARLEAEGFDVLVAADGVRGVAMAVEQKPDLILMDLDLPGIDGWEATRRIKRTASSSAIPIIAISAHAMAEHRDQALGAGCDDFETKPVAFATLLSKMRRLLARTEGG
jgi:two-component system, cell cycle response regulator DivK